MTEQNERLGYLRKKAINLPQSSGVYLMKNKQNKIIYVGKAKNLKNRLSSYFGSDKTLWLKVVAMVLQVFDFDYIMTDSEFEALVLENSLIKQNQPKYNILLKDDKGYSYIKVSKAPWARISESKKIEKDGSKYIGPYVSSWSVKSAIDEARKIFKLPSCNKVFPRDFGKSRPCLNFYIKQCNAPCLGKIKESDYAQNLEDALDFIKKGATESIKDLRRKMENAAENLEFEKAAFLRDKINAINKITETQKIVQSSIAFQDIIATATSEEKTAITVLKFRTGKLCDRQDYIFEKANLDEILQEFIQRYYENHEIPPRITLEKLLFDYEITEKWLSEKAEKKVAFFIPQKGEQLKLLEMCKSNAAEKLTDGTSKKGKDIVALEELSKLLGLKEIPRFIESYDISNTAGSENVAAMIVYKDGRPYKSSYRKFKIKGFDGQDDYGSMREVIIRRFREYELSKDTDEGFGKMPDLILLDGGKNHVSVIKPLLRGMGIDVPVFGMVKDNKHKTRAIAMDGGEIAINSNRSAFTLVSAIQEEVHRFAIGYHRQLRSKNILTSSLTQIEGIGKTRATELLKHFGTINKIANASIDELLDCKVMNQKSAENVKNHFKK